MPPRTRRLSVAVAGIAGLASSRWSPACWSAVLGSGEHLGRPADRDQRRRGQGTRTAQPELRAGRAGRQRPSPAPRQGTRHQPRRCSRGTATARWTRGVHDPVYCSGWQGRHRAPRSVADRGRRPSTPPDEPGRARPTVSASRIAGTAGASACQATERPSVRCGAPRWRPAPRRPVGGRRSPRPARRSGHPPRSGWPRRPPIDQIHGVKVEVGSRRPSSPAPVAPVALVLSANRGALGPAAPAAEDQGGEQRGRTCGCRPTGRRSAGRPASSAAGPRACRRSSRPAVYEIQPVPITTPIMRERTHRREQHRHQPGRVASWPRSAYSRPSDGQRERGQPGPISSPAHGPGPTLAARPGGPRRAGSR